MDEMQRKSELLQAMTTIELAPADVEQELAVQVIANCRCHGLRLLAPDWNLLLQQYSK